MIDPILMDFIVHLAADGHLPVGGDLMELGAEVLAVPPGMMARQVAAADWPLALGGLTERLEASESVRAAEAYRALGVAAVVSLDRFEPAAELRHDLNEPLTPARRFDAVFDFGTSEHVFNVGQSLQTAFEAAREGGVIVWLLPAMGSISHGFYSIHPNVLLSLAHVNDCEILAFHYVDNWELRSQTYGETGGRFDFIGLPILPELRHLSHPIFGTAVVEQYMRNYAELAALGLPAYKLLDMTLLAVRRRSDRPFVWPQQQNYWFPEDRSGNIIPSRLADRPR